MHGHHKDSLHIAKVTLVSLGKQRAIYSSAGAATLIKTRAARNGVVHVIDSLVWKCWDNPKTKWYVGYWITGNKLDVGEVSKLWALIRNLQRTLIHWWHLSEIDNRDVTMTISSIDQEIILRLRNVKERPARACIQYWFTESQNYWLSGLSLWHQQHNLQRNEIHRPQRWWLCWCCWIIVELSSSSWAASDNSSSWSSQGHRCCCCLLSMSM